jgi:4-amino-4-deoxy-L-arabinose transferase-like glycosyltransferase
MTATRKRALVCLILFGLIWFWGLGHRPLFETDEGRYAEIPREMLVSGNWVTPRLDGLRYFEKPPLQYWMTAATYAVFGVHDWTARLWTAIAGFITVLFAGLAATKLYGERAGLLSAAILAGSFYFAYLSHFNTLDSVLCMAMSINLFGFLLAQRASPHSRAELGWMLVSWAGAALAVLDKGLIGILLPGAVLVLYMLLKRDAGMLRRLHILPGLALFLAMVLPWFIAVSVQNADFLWEFFMVQQFLRFLTPAQNRSGPGWYFLPLLLLAILPWVVASVRAFFARGKRLIRRETFNPAVLLWLWAVFIFIFFSISDSKLPSYILPIIPAIAVLIGCELDRLRRLPLTAAAISILLGALVVVLAYEAPAWGLVKGSYAALFAGFTPWAVAAGALVMVATAVAIALRRQAMPAIVIIAVAWLIATRLLMFGSATFIGPSYTTRQLVAEVARYNHPDSPVYSVAGYQQTLPFYLRRNVTIVKYQGELKFGIEHARAPLTDRYIPNMRAFAARWRREPDALAFVPRQHLANVKALGIHYRVVAANAKWVAFVHPGRA